jgi:ectoine hydroxylase-related dioxygenase (phytanoyl-CoA dioxygenase family)
MLPMLQTRSLDSGAADRVPAGPGLCFKPLRRLVDAGSCVFFVGTLWHGGGCNRSASARLAITAQYCEPWLRPQEALSLSVDRAVASALSEERISMLGYSIHPPFLGMVNGLHPRRLLQG